MQISAGDVVDASLRLRGHVRRTPIVEDAVLTDRRGAPVLLKLECWQRTGSFKVRGAYNRVLALSPEEGRRGLIVVSAGNHALGVAAATHELGLDLLAIMPRQAPAAKVEGVRRLGARVELLGDTYDDAAAEAAVIVRRTGRTLVHPFADPAVIAGQGTIGLELAASRRSTDTVLVPAGGGGLMCGIATALRALRPEVRIMGVQSEASAPLVAAFEAGRHVPVAFSPSVADGLHGDTTPEMVEFALRLVDGCLAVSETAIVRAMRHLFYHQRLVVEGSAAVGVAAVMEGLVPEGSVTVVLSGANIDADRFLALVAGPAHAAG
jgi:threonine dehydratase